MPVYIGFENLYILGNNFVNLCTAVATNVDITNQVGEAKTAMQINLCMACPSILSKF